MSFGIRLLTGLLFVTLTAGSVNASDPAPGNTVVDIPAGSNGGNPSTSSSSSNSGNSQDNSKQKPKKRCHQTCFERGKSCLNRIFRIGRKKEKDDKANPTDLESGLAKPPRRRHAVGSNLAALTEGLGQKAKGKSWLVAEIAPLKLLEPLLTPTCPVRALRRIIIEYLRSEGSYLPEEDIGSIVVVEGKLNESSPYDLAYVRKDNIRMVFAGPQHQLHYVFLTEHGNLERQKEAFIQPLKDFFRYDDLDIYSLYKDLFQSEGEETEKQKQARAVMLKLAKIWGARTVSGADKANWLNTAPDGSWHPPSEFRNKWTRFLGVRHPLRAHAFVLFGNFGEFFGHPQDRTADQGALPVAAPRGKGN